MPRKLGHLSDVQRAVEAARMANTPQGGSRDRAHGTVTQEEAAREYNVSLRAVRKARRILKRGIPELVSLLAGDEISLDKAEKISRKTPEEQVAEIRELPRRKAAA